MSSLSQDLRQAFRFLGRNPGFAAAALALLSLGIGIQTTAFSLLDAVVLRSLPGVARPHELFDLRAGGLSYPTFSDLRRETDVFSGLAAWGNRAFDLTTSSSARRVRGTVVSGDYFGVLGDRAARGRLLTRADEESAELIAVISERIWRNDFGASPAAIGSTARVNGVPVTIVGVAPAGFRGVGFGQRSDLWIPVGSFRLVATGALARMDYRRRGWGWLSAFGRLKPGVSRSAAQAAVDAAARRQVRAYPDAIARALRIPLEPLAATAAGSTDPARPAQLLGLLCAAVGLVLLVTCANLANLLLTRALSRRQEIGVRLALGARRDRIGRQLLTESLVLALLGGAGGLAVAQWMLSLIVSIPLPGDATLDDFAPVLDHRALFVAFAASLVTGVVFGIAPALRASRTDLVSALKRSSPGGIRRFRLDRVLVASQVALCLVLLSMSGLFLRSLRSALATNVGFQTRAVATASVQLGLSRYDADRANAFLPELAARVGALPGVRAAAWVGDLPLSGGYSEETMALDRDPDRQITVDVAVVGPGYFRTLDVPMLEGREFDARTERPAEEPRAAVVNEAAARHFWPGENAVGRRIRSGDAEATVVGVCADTRFRSLTDAHRPLVYFPMAQLGGDAVLSQMTLLARTDGDPASLAGPIAAEIARLNPALPVFGPRTLQQTLEGNLLPQKTGGALLTVFAALTLALSALGIYGVVAATAARRVRELALRLALGAHPGRLRLAMLQQSAVPVGAGLAVGLVLALFVARLAGRFLFGVTSTDAPSFAIAVLVLAVSALLAADLPARRVLRVDPVQALRTE